MAIKGLFPVTRETTKAGKRLYFGITGSSQPECQDAIKHIVKAFDRSDEIRDQEVILIPDPDNEHDKYAVRVMWQDLFLGYVPRWLCPKCEKKLGEADIDEQVCPSCGAQVTRENSSFNKLILEYIKDDKLKSAHLAWAIAHANKNAGAAVEAYVED